MSVRKGSVSGFEQPSEVKVIGLHAWVRGGPGGESGLQHGQLAVPFMTANGNTSAPPLFLHD